MDSCVGGSIALFSMRKINCTAATIAMLLAACLFVWAIVSLYLAKGNNLRLAMICVFTVAFSLSINLFTNAKTAGLFTATAPYVCTALSLVGRLIYIIVMLQYFWFLLAGV